MVMVNKIYVVFIHLMVRKNVNIKDVVIRDLGDTTSTTTKYGVYVDTGGSEHQIQNLNTHFNLGAPSTYGIYIKVLFLILIAH